MHLMVNWSLFISLLGMEIETPSAAISADFSFSESTSSTIDGSHNSEPGTSLPTNVANLSPNYTNFLEITHLQKTY